MIPERLRGLDRNLIGGTLLTLAVVSGAFWLAFSDKAVEPSNGTLSVKQESEDSVLLTGRHFTLQEKEVEALINQINQKCGIVIYPDLTDPIPYSDMRLQNRRSYCATLLAFDQ